ncbi:CHAT domain-containing protein [Modestobacter muralis]|uniref:CHAT domain-containing protein n=1 Tax=Modestobacter muralis TaxID=1608614 RepID=A0A6P0EU16_9ACTN|nr:CHAT domain-containing protein [Modestobacter muralis]NEN51353.1 CHAT domain-containing protein [Modestobacter muralis]
MDGEVAAGPAQGAGAPVRVFISYAHDSPEHEERVRDFWLFLRRNGLDAKIDLPAAEQRQDWPAWMSAQVREAEHVLVIASPAYAERAEDRAPDGAGLGVRWETKFLREILYRDDQEALQKVVPVVLPGGRREDLPDWVHPMTHTLYPVTAYTVAGAERLLRLLTRQPGEVEPPVGTVPVLAPRAGSTVSSDLSSAAGKAQAAADVGAATRHPSLGTRVVVELTGRPNGQVHSRVSVADAELSERTSQLPTSVIGVWQALEASPLVARARLAAAGRDLAQALFDPATARQIGKLVDLLPPRDRVEVDVMVDEATLDVPVELLVLPDAAGNDLGPLVLRPGVSLHRRVLFASGSPVVPSAGPVRVLAAVAAPEETRTTNPPLDVEGEMQALLDAVAPVAEQPGVGVRVLEVAGLPQITAALREAAQHGSPFHVLHLSAHGSSTSLELEDEDGNPVPVTATQLVDALRRAEVAVPVVVLSSCRGATEQLAGELLRRGADRVIAMQAAVSDTYATDLARALYAGLARNPGRPVGLALAEARINVDDDQQDRARRAQQRPGASAQRDTEAGAAQLLVLPEFGVPVLLAAGEDRPLVDPDLPPVSLPSAEQPASGKGARELPVGRLIGRRRQLRTALAVLRRTTHALETYGATAGVVLTGPGGIGKTALAGRVMARMRADGWAVAVHEGAWNPDALLAAAADGLDAAGLQPEAARLRDKRVDAADRLIEVAARLGDARLLLVFDDFEQNLTDGGQAFRDPSVDELFTQLCNAAQSGAVLVTCRYPLPDDDRWLARVEVPPLSTAELRRLLLRMSALRDLTGEEWQAVARTIGGHARLIEFVDALLRGGWPDLRDTAVKMKRLARQNNIDLRQPRAIEQALDEAVLLGAADILLEQLLALLTPAQSELLAQAAVCRAPLSVSDLLEVTAVAPADDLTEAPPVVGTDVERLIDLTLLTRLPAAGGGKEEVVVQPWAGQALTHSFADDAGRQERASDLHLRRFHEGRGRYEDLLDMPRHLAALGEYDAVATLAGEAFQMLGGSLQAGAYLAEVRPLVPAGERAAMLLADLEMRALITTGNVSAARRLAEGVQQEAMKRAEADPANIGWQRDLSISHIKLGDLARAGDLTAAGEHYRAALAITERLAEADPANIGWQRDLGVSRTSLGDLAEATRDLPAAAEHYRAALAIDQRLAEADPANTEWQRDLSIDRSKLGHLAQKTGDLPAAGEHYRAALAIRQRLADADPANTEWQRDLGISHTSLGNLAQATGNLPAAGEHYRAALAIDQRLADADPANTEWQRDLGIDRSKLGNLAQMTGDLPAAGEYYRAALAIRQRLADADPANTEWQRDLGVSHTSLGHLAQATGDLPAAGEHYRAALAITERLVEADPANPDWQQGLAVSQASLGVLAQAVGNLAEAEVKYRAALTAAERARNTEVSAAMSRALADALIAGGRLVEGLPYAVAAWRVLRGAEKVVAVLAEARWLLGEKEFIRLLSEQLEADELTEVLAAAVPSVESGEGSPAV